MAKQEYRAACNLVVGEGKAPHKSVKKGEKFSCSSEYHDEHLAPYGHTEESLAPASKGPKPEADSDEKKKSKKGE